MDRVGELVIAQARLSQLAESGSDKTKVVQATIWLADHKTFAEMNEIWDAWAPEGHAPARACVESALAFPPYTATECRPPLPR